MTTVQPPILPRIHDQPQAPAARPCAIARSQTLPGWAAARQADRREPSVPGDPRLDQRFTSPHTPPVRTGFSSGWQFPWPARRQASLSPAPAAARPNAHQPAGRPGTGSRDHPAPAGKVAEPATLAASQQLKFLATRDARFYKRSLSFSPILSAALSASAFNRACLHDPHPPICLGPDPCELSCD